MQRLWMKRTLIAIMVASGMNLGTTQKSEAMVGAGIAAIVISESPEEVWAAIGFIALTGGIAYYFGNPIALVLDVPPQNDISTAVAQAFPFIDDQAVNQTFAALIQEKFAADAAQGILRPVALSNAEIDPVLENSAQLFTEEQVAEIKRKLQ